MAYDETPTTILGDPMFRKKKALVRILDVPTPMIIEPTFIAVNLPNNKVMIIHGNFENITDDDANLLAHKARTKLAV